MGGESSRWALIAMVYAIAIGAQEARASNCAAIETDPANMALQTPVTGSEAQLGARFGIRKHPILDRGPVLMASGRPTGSAEAQ